MIVRKKAIVKFDIFLDSLYVNEPHGWSITNSFHLKEHLIPTQKLGISFKIEYPVWLLT